mmetsp:Transcript_19052/g.54671  ORF Transcript_19052/g.54671 Transcript_19052/m.54671 type:complete len:212 (-) Transcript_19052:1266-1901(-)
MQAQAKRCARRLQRRASARGHLPGLGPRGLVHGVHPGPGAAHLPGIRVWRLSGSSRSLPEPGVWRGANADMEAHQRQDEDARRPFFGLAAHPRQGWERGLVGRGSGARRSGPECAGPRCHALKHRHRHLRPRAGANRASPTGGGGGQAKALLQRRERLRAFLRLRRGAPAREQRHEERVQVEPRLGPTAGVARGRASGFAMVFEERPVRRI